ncbi:MAG: VWA domain-containing protein, partial [Minicystis sp.]
MSFLSLGALAIVLLVAAPIAAHMLRRRMAEEKAFPPARLVPPTPPAARRRSMLEDRALFSIRALAVVGLALLGATPFVRCSRLALNRKEGASVALAIVLDDSLSMRAPLDGGKAGKGKKTRFDRAMEAARELGGTLGAGDAAAIILAGGPARVALGSTTNTSALMATLDGLTVSDRATDLEGAVGLAKGLLRGLVQRDKRVVVLSDLADGAPDAPALAGDADIAVWVPLPELSASGQDCAVTRADRAGNRVWARVICTSVEAGARGAASAMPAGSAPSGPSGSAGRTLEIRSGAKVIASTPLGASVRADEVAVDLPAGAPEILLAALTGEDAIAEDDQAPVVAAGGALPTAVVVDAALTHVATGGPPPIEQAFAALQLDAQIHPLPSVPEHDAELNAYAALIVDDAPGFTPEVRRSITAWVERGGVALLTLGPRAAAAPLGAGFEPLVPGVVRWGASPSPGIDPASAPTLGPSADGLATLDPRGRAILDASASEGAELLARWKDGAPFLMRRAIGRGAVLTLTLPLNSDDSDLVLRPAFLALLDRFVSTARSRGGARRIDVGEAWTFDGYRKVAVR